MKRILVAIALLLAPSIAFAQTPPYAYPITVGTAQVQVLGADNGAGSVTILPYAAFTADGVGQNGALPSPWNAIASAPGSALSILEFE
jgi:hypothetical protein